MIRAEVARAEARLGAARINLLDTVSEIYQRAGPTAPIGLLDRARTCLAGSHAITSAAAVADWSYKAGGVDAIFPGSPFECRFRDIHTLSQQLQSRDAHYETVGQGFLGNPPEVFFSREPTFPITVRRVALASLGTPCLAELNPCSADLIPCSPA